MSVGDLYSFFNFSLKYFAQIIILFLQIFIHFHNCEFLPTKQVKNTSLASPDLNAGHTAFIEAV